LCYTYHVTDEAALDSQPFRALTDRIEKMREEERARIARELHDELGQLLTGIKLDFASSLRRLREFKAPGDIVDRVQSAMGQIDLGIAMVRRIATDLRPAQLDHHDLGGAIEQEARRVAGRTGLRIRVATRLTTPIEAARSTAAFRIFQEALTNAVRHGNPTRVAARVSTLHSTLRLCIQDDGVGIPAHVLARPQSLGLLGMHERARSLGGVLRVSSEAGRGTTILVTLPQAHA
jgi:signal transduction histidine kinase